MDDVAEGITIPTGHDINSEVAGPNIALTKEFEVQVGGGDGLLWGCSSWVWPCAAWGEAIMRAVLLCAVLGSLFAAPLAAAGDVQLQVTAKLVEIPGQFPPDDLYDYAYVMKYEVIRGDMKGQSLLVAHYRPRQKRKEIKDKMKEFVGGELKRFKQGDVHELVLESKLEKIWQGAVIDDFFATDRKSTRYWCLRVNLAR